MLVEKLKSTPVANRKFAQYYKRNGLQLPISLKDFLSAKNVRYQQQIFIDFIASQNIGLLITPVGFTAYILDPSKLDESDKDMADILFVEVNEDRGWYVLAMIDVKKIRSERLDAILAHVRTHAIVWAMEYLNMENNYLLC